MSESTGPTWKERKRPIRLECRVEFTDYEATRDYLDRVAAESEASDIYPDTSFGKTYVNLTLHLEDGADALTDEQKAFARRLDALLSDDSNPRLTE